MSRKRPEHQESGIFSSNNDMGVFGLGYGIFSIFKGIFHALISDGILEATRVWSETTQSYHYSDGTERDKNGKKVYTRAYYGEDVIQYVGGYASPITRNISEEKREAQRQEIDKTNPGEITVRRRMDLERCVDRRFGHTDILAVFEDRETKKIYKAVSFYIKPRRRASFYLDKETFVIVRPTDYTRKLVEECKRNGIDYLTTNDLDSFTQAYNKKVKETTETEGLKSVYGNITWEYTDIDMMKVDYRGFMDCGSDNFIDEEKLKWEIKNCKEISDAFKHESWW